MNHLNEQVGGMVCTRCGSPHIQSVPVVVALETRTVEAETRDPASGAARRETRVTRSRLAEELAAPVRPSVLPGVFFSAFVFLAYWLVLPGVLPLPTLPIHFVALPVAAAVAAFFLHRKHVRAPKLAAWEIERERWEREFFCRKCGNKFVP